MADTPENYKDEVRERILELIERKVAGEDITVTPTEEPETKIVDPGCMLCNKPASPRTTSIACWPLSTMMKTASAFSMWTTFPRRPDSLPSIPAIYSSNTTCSPVTNCVAGS